MTANAGYHAYATGDVLTAAQVQYNLQNQTVMYFATTTARDAALTGAILVEGMVSYTPATGVMYYNGTAWTAVGSTIPTSYGFTAGKNRIINGDFGVWQRGTSISLTNNVTSYVCDRFRVYSSFSAGTTTFTQQTFTPGTAPVSGYEGTYFGRLTLGSTATYWQLEQPIEDVRTYAGQTVTFSFWAKAGATVVVTPSFYQAFGTGGSSGVTTNGSNLTITTSWTRYTSTVTLPSVAGKTIGTSSNLALALLYVSGTINSSTVDTWGWQLEAGSTATAFQTATGTVQGELAACQRYYYRLSGASGQNNFYIGSGTVNASGSNAYIYTKYPTTMRVVPTFTFLSAGNYYIVSSPQGVATSVGTDNPGVDSAGLTFAKATMVAYGSATIQANTSSAYIEMSAEL